MEPLDPPIGLEESRLEVGSEVPRPLVQDRRALVVPLGVLGGGPPVPIEQDPDGHAPECRGEGRLEEKVRSPVPFRLDVQSLDPHAVAGGCEEIEKSPVPEGHVRADDHPHVPRRPALPGTPRVDGRRRCESRRRLHGGPGVPTPGIEVLVEHGAQASGDRRIRQGDGPSAVPRPVVRRESCLPEVLGSDPGRHVVDDRVLRMEVPVPLHDVLTAGEEADLDPGREEAADETPLLGLESSDRRSFQEDSDGHAAPRGLREDGGDPLACERVYAHVDPRSRGGEKREEGAVPAVRRHDRGDRPGGRHWIEGDVRLAEPIDARAVPIGGVVPVEGESERVVPSDRDLAASHRPRGWTHPSGTRIRRIAVDEYVDEGPRRVREEDLVPVVRKAKDASLHLPGVPPIPREVCGREEVLRVRRGVPRHDDPPAGRKDDLRGERGNGLAVAQGPTAKADPVRADVHEFDELVVASGARVYPGEEDVRSLARPGKRCGRGRRGRAEVSRSAGRMEEGGGHEEASEDNRRSVPHAPHAREGALPRDKRPAYTHATSRGPCDPGRGPPIRPA